MPSSVTSLRPAPTHLPRQPNAARRGEGSGCTSVVSRDIEAIFIRGTRVEHLSFEVVFSFGSARIAVGCSAEG